MPAFWEMLHSPASLFAWETHASCHCSLQTSHSDKTSLLPSQHSYFRCHQHKHQDKNCAKTFADRFIFWVYIIALLACILERVIDCWWSDPFSLMSEMGGQNPHSLFSANRHSQVQSKKLIQGFSSLRQPIKWESSKVAVLLRTECSLSLDRFSLAELQWRDSNSSIWKSTSVFETVFSMVLQPCKIGYVVYVFTFVNVLFLLTLGSA